MARITVEDCLEKVNNRFELVILASKRARQLAISAIQPHVPVENDKPTVLALREIAGGFITANNVEQNPNEAEEQALLAMIPTQGSESEAEPTVVNEEEQVNDLFLEQALANSSLFDISDAPQTDAPQTDDGSDAS